MSIGFSRGFSWILLPLISLKLMHFTFFFHCIPPGLSNNSLYKYTIQYTSQVGFRVLLFFWPIKFFRIFFYNFCSFLQVEPLIRGTDDKNGQCQSLWPNTQNKTEIKERKVRLMWQFLGKPHEMPSGFF